LKRYREKYDSKSKKLQEVNEELERTQRLLKKMKNLVDDKKLAERDELARKLEKARTELEVKEETVKVHPRSC
jgi:cysteinyl-tRNA synthetase